MPYLKYGPPTKEGDKILGLISLLFFGTALLYYIFF